MTEKTDKGERIAKVMARAGLCSRRDAERWIAEGRVAVDGAVLTGPAVTVTPESRVLVDGKPLPLREPARLWRYHKPRGLLTTARDPEGRRTVFEALPRELPRLVAVGRLDVASEGLLLLTNDGGVARRLELPETGWVRRYRVRVFGTVDAERLAALADGVTIEGIHYAGIEAAVDSRTGRNAWLTMALKEGKNREVRRVCEHLDLQVNRLIRIAFGPFQLGSLSRGAIEEVPRATLERRLGSEKRPRTGWAKAKAKPDTRRATKKPGSGRREGSAARDADRRR